MRFVEIIEKKRDGFALREEEIQFWIQGVTNGSIPDYQSSALLMAIVLKGMNPQETAALTKAMMHSGDVIDLTSIHGIKSDKHSTGGVGDKTSLALGPMVAACGLKIAKMSGRGLGHTGGTLDKLESIAGFNCYLSQEDFIKQVNEIGIAIIGQTASLVPADKKLYALRDVTGTVPAIPLIASSIMSKKLASGADTILLDVKYGEGAFMHTSEDAKLLATSMIEIGRQLGRDTMAMISDMNQPLGNAIGNALEVREAVETLQGKGPADFTELCLQAGEIMLVQGKVCKTKEEGRAMLLQAIADGSAFLKFKEMVQYQSGDTAMIDDLSKLPQASYITDITARKDGYVASLQAEKIGTLGMKLGAGRETAEDVVDPAVGIVLACKKGDYVLSGDVIAHIHSNKPLTSDWMEEFHQTIAIVDHKVDKTPLIDSVL